MKTGYSKVCINPPYGAPIVGYYEHRYVKGILDNLYARAVAFDDGVKKSVIIAVDVCLLSQPYINAMKEAVQKSTGVDSDSIFINCSHTHTGPLIGKDFASDDRSSETYDNFLISCVRDSAVYALSDLKESKFGIASGEAKNISFVRRYRMKDGSVATNPGVNNPNIDHALAEPNETVKLVKITREDGEDIFIINFGTHSDSVGGEFISADYMGFACDILEKAVPNTKCVFLLGPQGDVNHVNVHPTKGESAISTIDFDSVPRSHKHAEHMGRIIAGAVLSICSITEEIKCDKISYASSIVNLPTHQENDRIPEMRKIYDLYNSGRASELPYKEMALTTKIAEAKRIINLENGPLFIPFSLSAVKIGDLVFAGVDGEPFTEIGNRICEASPFKSTVLCCLTNGSGGYVPTTKSYEEGGYEACSSALKPGGDDILVNGMLDLLKSL